MPSTQEPRSVGASRKLERIEPTKEGEERRLLDGFLNRLSLTPSEIEKSERPDFFLRFTRSSKSVRIACEIVRFHSPTDGPTRLDHGHRWRVFAVKLREGLQRIGLSVCGVIQLRDGSSDAFETLLRHRDQSVAEICNALRRNGATAGNLDAFDGTVEPILASSVKFIGWDPMNENASELWWCSSLQSGPLPDPWPSLIRIVKEKDEKARAWNWRNAEEHWLLVVAEGQTLGDTMVLTDPAELPLLLCKAFTRTFLWDGFSEQIHQLHPNYGLVFDVDTQGRGIIHRRTFPSAVAACCPLLSGP